MKKAGMQVGPSEGGGQIGLLHHPFEPYVTLPPEFFAAEPRLLEAPARPRGAMKNALLAPLGVNTPPSKRSSSPC
jgi:hypothetical protein